MKTMAIWLLIIGLAIPSVVTATDGLSPSCPNIAKLTVMDSDQGNYHVYSWAGKSPYNGLSQVWVVSRSDDSGATWSTVQTSTSRSYSHTLDVTPGRRYRITASGAGASCEYDPPATLSAPFITSRLY